MAECPRCKTQLGCSCQLKSASDGTEVCEECIENYEIKLRVKRNEN
jgi:hypothetical protein